MNFIRTNLWRRGQVQERRVPDLEDQSTTNAEEQRHGDPRTLAEQPQSEARGRGVDGESEQENGPKPASPDSLSSPAKPIPRPNEQASEDGARTGESASSVTNARTERFPVNVTQPPPAAARTNGRGPGRRRRHMRRSRFNGVTLADYYLPDLADSRRGPQIPEPREGGSSDRSHRRRPKDPPSRFLFCFPWVKSRRVRSLVLRCFVSGIFVVITLTIYLSLSLTRNINTNEFNILLILLILLTAIIFCHALTRLCLHLMRPRNRAWAGSAANILGFSHNGRMGYAVPQRPIRVILSQDEEAAGIESETVYLKPPAYGAWRESVRVDPNRLYWQRAESLPPWPATSAVSTEPVIEESEPDNTLRRPPSYVSDDGVDYVLGAHPRSIAPPPSSVHSQPSRARTPTASETTDAPSQSGESDPEQPVSCSAAEDEAIQM